MKELTDFFKRGSQLLPNSLTFKIIDPETSHKFAKTFEKMELDQDDIIAEPGEPSDCFFIVMSG